MIFQRTFHGGGPGGFFGGFFGGHDVGGMFSLGPRGGNGFGGLVVLILFFLVLIGIAWVITGLLGHGPTLQHTNAPTTPSASAPGTGPIDVLRMRLAKGEIGEDEYTSRLRLLQDDHVTS